MTPLVTIGLLLVSSTNAEHEGTDIDQRVERLGRLMRCPVCQGMPIVDSPSEMAQAMMGTTRDLVVKGHSDQEVLDYFVRTYGEWVLLDPPRQGIAWLLWLLPPASVVIALVLAFVYLRARMIPKVAITSGDREVEASR